MLLNNKDEPLINPWQDSERETKHRVTVPKRKFSAKHRSSTGNTGVSGVNRDAFQLPLCPCSSPGAPGGAGGADNGTRNRVVMAFTSWSFEQQNINFSHSIINALWWFSLQGNLRTRGFWRKGENCYFKIYQAWCMILSLSVLCVR